ncbi:Tho complex subunit 7-domain-containing protein [Suillus variegatus]|nr:Tho complex subunit 7-domain-containing protein [Suillus variegatus]
MAVPESTTSNALLTDAIIHTRITNDERPLRRVVKKFHNYASLVHHLLVPPSSSGTVEDAREAFLIELSSFELALKKSMMVCEAERRQVEEYQREREKIEKEHDALRSQIEELKVALEHAHMERKRKVEYDTIAEKINTLPSREELEQAILSLENDMAAINAEHETQDRIIRGQKTALDSIVMDLSSLRLMGKDKESATSGLGTPAATPAPDGTEADDNLPNMRDSSQIVDEGLDEDEKETGEVAEEKEDGEDDQSIGTSLSSKLNPAVNEFAPSSHTPSSLRPPEEDDDIEMGEVAEDPKVKAKKAREELEEGEASDASSALSDPPDD